MEYCVMVFLLFFGGFIPVSYTHLDVYKRQHLCSYSYMPQWLGTSRDGKNARKPEQQTSEFMDGLSAPLQKVFAAYGVDSYVDMIGLSLIHI